MICAHIGRREKVFSVLGLESVRTADPFLYPLTYLALLIL